MAERVHNPFAALSVEYPTEFQAEFHELCRSVGGDPDRKPFERMIDLWFLALCVAVRLNLEPVSVPTADRKKMIEGSIFDGDPWRIQAIMLISLARTGQLDVLLDAPGMLAMCSGLAAAGLPHVVDMAREGKSPAIWNLSEAVGTLLGTPA